VASASFASTEVVRTLIDRIVADKSLPRRVRQRALGLLELADSDPALAETNLQELYRNGITLLTTQTPDEDLCRCLSMHAFFTRMIDKDRRAEYKDAIDFADVVSRQSNPGLVLKQLLRRDEPLFPHEHTWMAPCKSLSGLTGEDLKRALALKGSEPPYAVFVMDRQRLLAAGVRVRPATSLDAIPAGVTYWDPDGLPTGILELVDDDILQAALGRIEWRP
jgi:hypothetical protein